MGAVNISLECQGFHQLDDPANVYRTFLGDAGAYLTLTLNGNNDLVITRSDSSDTITIKNFDKTNKTLGIDITDKLTMAYNGSDLDAIFFRNRSATTLNQTNSFSLPAAYANATVIDDGPGSTPTASASDGNDIYYGSGIVDIIAFAMPTMT